MAEAAAVLLGDLDKNCFAKVPVGEAEAGD